MAKSYGRHALVFTFLTGLCLGSPLAAQGGGEAGPRARPESAAHHRDMVIAVGGDLLGPYASFANLSSPGFAPVRRLFEQAHAGFANQEGSVFATSDFRGWPAAENGGGTPLSDPVVARELRAMGITLMSKANNHATDWDMEGLMLTERTLRAADITIAGSGPNESAARAPAFRDTPAGRIGLVSTASSFTPMSRAGNAVPQSRGRPLRDRPGISVLRTNSAMNVNTRELEQLTAMARRRGVSVDETGSPRGLRLGQQSYRLSEAPGGTFEMNADDRDAVLAAVGASAREARVTIFTIHAHETASSGGPRPLDGVDAADDPMPADFLPDLFHRAIDAGASMVVRHGPHTLNGIEIYNGRPIFYSMGSLYFDFGGRRSYTIPGTDRTINFPDGWFESAVATVRYRGDRMVEVRLYPVMIELSQNPTNGLPLQASGADARRILARLQRDSAPFGTLITIEGDVGVIRPPVPAR